MMSKVLTDKAQFVSNCAESDEEQYGAKAAAAAEELRIAYPCPAVLVALWPTLAISPDQRT